MTLDIKKIKQYAEEALGDILEGSENAIMSEIGADTGALTLKVRDGFPLCGYDVLPQFMFMKDGEVYFFTLLDEIDITAENAALAFEASTSTALSVSLDDYLTFQLGTYLFNEENAGDMIIRYFEDLIYLLEDDDSVKKLLSRMK